MTAGRIDDLVDALAARKSELGLSNSFIEHALLMGEHGLDKLIGPTRRKNLTVTVAHDLAELMGCRLILQVDPELEAKMRARWELRDNRKVHPSRRVSQTILERAKPIFHQTLAASGAEARNRVLSSEQRKEIARTAAHSRWRLHRAAVKARAVAEARQ
jgi:hypothetical protein